MKLQQWGTFSVRDHLKPRAFVADVLLFDKLVIPRPATPTELYAEGQLDPNGDQRDRGIQQGWGPDRQRELLDVLGEYELAVELPWGNQAQRDWQIIHDQPDLSQLECGRSDLTQAIETQIRLANENDVAYIMTGSVLSLYVANMLHNDVATRLFALAKIPDVPVEPVIAYGSYAEFSTDQGLRLAEGENPDAPAAPYAMFGWEFFVPEDNHSSDAHLLRKAAKLATRSDLCEARQSFQGWLKLMYGSNVDQRDAYDHMMKMLDEYRKIVRESGLATVARYAAKAAPVLAPLAGLALHSAGAGVGVGVAASSASLCLEWLLPSPQIPDRLRPAALLYDARQFFYKH
ncbi:MAG: hypothetical protein ABSE51_17550 [Terracidiphilus sp.]|jgi:hypothetical protein